MNTLYMFVLREIPVLILVNDYGERELVIVSDLKQYSERVNFYKHCKTAAEKLKPKNKQ